MGWYLAQIARKRVSQNTCKLSFRDDHSPPQLNSSALETKSTYRKKQQQKKEVTWPLSGGITETISVAKIIIIQKCDFRPADTEIHQSWWIPVNI